MARYAYSCGQNTQILCILSLKVTCRVKSLSHAMTLVVKTGPELGPKSANIKLRSHFFGKIKGNIQSLSKIQSKARFLYCTMTREIQNCQMWFLLPEGNASFNALWEFSFMGNMHFVVIAASGECCQHRIVKIFILCSAGNTAVRCGNYCSVELQLGYTAKSKTNRLFAFL